MTATSARPWVMALVLACAGSARADVRVWSEAGEVGEVAPAEEEPRYLDVVGFLQPGYVWRQTDEEVAAATTVPASDDQLRLHRARLGARALVYPWLMLYLELDFVEERPLRDAWVDLRIDDALRVRVGQMKVPLLQSFLFRDAWTGFIDRPLYVPSWPDRPFLAFAPRRDLGVLIHGTVGDTEAGPALQYGVGAFAGTGPNRYRDPDSVLMLAARVEGHLFGVPEGDDAENDLARNISPKLAVGLGGFTNCDELEQWNRGFTVDTELRFRGLYASAGFLWTKNGPRDGDFLAGPVNYGHEEACGAPSDPVFARTFIAWGTHLQAQYALPSLLFPVDGQTLEARARFDLVRPHAPPEGFFGGDEGSDGYVAPIDYASRQDVPDQWRLTFGLSWYPTDDPSLRLSVDYQHRQETEDVRPVDGPPIEELDNELLWVELTAGL